MTDGGVTDGADGGAAATDGAGAADGGTVDDEAVGGEDEDLASASYSALWRTFKQSRRDSASLILRSYVWVSALIGLLLVVTVLLAMPVWIAETAGRSAIDKIGRGVLPVLVLGLLVPLFAPALYVARNHRRGTATRRGDAALGLAGYLYVLSIYLALVVSAPAEFRTDPAGVLAPAIEFVYSLPQLSSIFVPVLGALLIAAVQRIVR